MKSKFANIEIGLSHEIVPPRWPKSVIEDDLRLAFEMGDICSINDLLFELIDFEMLDSLGFYQNMRLGIRDVVEIKKVWE